MNMPTSRPSVGAVLTGLATILGASLFIGACAGVAVAAYRTAIQILTNP